MKTRTSGKAFFDTNVLIYAFRAGDSCQGVAAGLLAEGGVISVQVLNEFAAVARRKLGMSWKELSKALAAIRVLCPTPVAVTIETHEAALGIAERHGYGFYDSLIIAAALEGGCKTLYSEDLQDGQVIEGMVVKNPFAGQGRS